MLAIRIAPVVAALLGLAVTIGATGCGAISGHASTAPSASQLSASAGVSRPSGHPATAPASSPAVKGKSPGAVQNLRATAAVRSALLAAYAATKSIPVSDVAGTRPGSVYYGYDRATGTYWAMASYDPSSKAPQAVVVSFQDGGATGFFTRQTAGPWRTSLGGIPMVCGELRFFPKAALAAWSLPTAHPSAMC